MKVIESEIARKGGGSVASWVDAVVVDALQGECPRGACDQKGMIGDPCPVDPHLKFKAVA